MKIKKGDTIRVISGKNKGQTGEVMRVDIDRERVVVEGINIVKKHRRAARQGQESGIIERPAPLHVSNVQLLCPKCKLPTRVGYVGEGTNKKRQCKKCHKDFL